MSFFVKEKDFFLFSPHNGSEGVQKPKRKWSKLQADDNGNKDKEPLITAFREQRLFLLDRCVWMKVGGILAWNQITSNFLYQMIPGLSVLFTSNLARIGL